MTEDEYKKLQADPNVIWRSPKEGCIPQPFKRDPGLVRAELVDALMDYAQIFRQKAEMETSRAEAVEVMAQKINAGGSAEQPDIQTSQDFARAYYLLEMRFNEVKMRCDRLILEHGNN